MENLDMPENIKNMLDQLIKTMTEKGGMENPPVNIKVQCPTRKLNFQVDKFFAAGIYLMTSLKLKEDMDCDFEDLNDKTIISIDRLHQLNCLSIINGALHPLISCSAISQGFADLLIDDLITFTSKPRRFENFKIDILNLCKEIITEFLSTGFSYTQELIDRIQYILTNVWFMTYHQTDILADRASKESEKDESNETNGKTD